MKIFLISYDLSKPEQDYEGLIKEIEKFDCLHIQKSVWLICTGISCNQIYKQLESFIDDTNDKLFICPLEFKDVLLKPHTKEFEQWFTSHNYRSQTL